MDRLVMGSLRALAAHKQHGGTSRGQDFLLLPRKQRLQ